MFIKGNGLNSWLRQSFSLLALQKKSAQVFFSFLWMWHIVSMTSYCVLCQAPPCVCMVTFNLISLFSLIPVFLLMKHSDNAVMCENYSLYFFVSFLLSPPLPHSASNIVSRLQYWRTSQRGLLCCKCMQWMQMREQMEKSNMA